VRAPRPRLSPEAEARLTPRQRELLAALEALVVRGGFAELTMAQIAARVNCSLRTLYGISPSKDELVLTLVDRRLRRIGRRAIAALDESLSPLAALRAYLAAANEAVQPTTSAFAREFADLSGAQPLLDAHEGYVVAVTRSLLERAVAEGEIAPTDTRALAHVLGGLGREFSRVDAPVASTPRETANEITEIVLRGLPRAGGAGAQSGGSPKSDPPAVPRGGAERSRSDGRSGSQDRR
jgi:AcrR family transcriptional regulator